MRLPTSLTLLILGLVLGVFAAGPASAYEYGWLVGGLGPRKQASLTAPATRSVGNGVWAGIARAPGYRTGASGGPWRALVDHTVNGGGATPRTAAPRAASPPSPDAGAAAKGSTPPRR